MPRRVRPPETTRSEHWLRIAVNDRTSLLNRLVVEAFGWSLIERIEWVSPTREDDFAEYYDQAFLDRLGLSRLNPSLKDFWPAGGPRWDGLARTASQKVILVEAKAHIDEMVDFRSRACGDSLVRIEHSLNQAKHGCGAAADAPWSTPFFQFANRLAHLYFLADLNQVDAYLL